MRVRVPRNRRSPAKRVALLWRQCALVLLFVFVWDIGFELLAPLHSDAEAQLASVQIAGTDKTESHPDCGLPDHHCALSHHHHYPALLSTAQTIVLPAATERPAGTLAVALSPRPSAARLIRGPPAEA